LLSMQKKLAKDIFTLKKDGAKRHQPIPGPDRFYEVFILPTNSN
jgi:hypothetical protein